MPAYNSPSKSRTQSSIKALSSEINNLEPSSVVTFFEIDLTEIMEANDITNLGVEASAYGLSDSAQDNILRFHNNINIFNSYLKWQGHTYYPAPIQAEGFEVSSRGTLPTPELTISTQSEEGMNLMGLLRHQIRKFGDVIGAKVTRIRTFAKFLDVDNFLKVDSAGNVKESFLTDMASENLLEIPQGFEPDPYAELPRDIYFIERKVSENKAMLKYQLASSLDLEGLTLPKRVIFADRCMFQYRGPGCWYQHAYDERSGANEILRPIETLWDGSSGVGNWTNVTSRFELVADGITLNIDKGLKADPSENVFFSGDVLTFSGGATVTLGDNIQSTKNKNMYAQGSTQFFGEISGGTIGNNETASVNFSYKTFTSNNNNANITAVRASSYANPRLSIAESPVFTSRTEQIFRLKFKLTLTSGQMPTFQVINSVGANKISYSKSAAPTPLGNGTYKVDFKINHSANTASNNSKIQIFNRADSSFSITNVELARMTDEIPIIDKAGITDPDLKNKLLPTEAPPVATDNDEKIVDIIVDVQSSFVDEGRWDQTKTYQKGDYVYQQKNLIKYYYVAKVDVDKGVAPPNSDYWIADQCSKSLKACRMRWGTEGAVFKNESCQCVIGGAVSAGKGGLPYGGFPAAKRVQQTLS